METPPRTENAEVTWEAAGVTRQVIENMEAAHPLAILEGNQDRIRMLTEAIDAYKQGNPPPEGSEDLIKEFTG
jgi:hypothetical protein